MWNDARDLGEFYKTRLGRVVRQTIGRKLRAYWPDVAGKRVLGVGWAAPYLDMFRAHAERTVSLVPETVGTAQWPVGRRGLSVTANETAMPFADRSIDRLLLVHALEASEHVGEMMREIWRVLADDGRLLIVAPNRRSLWAQLDHTPFGRGRSFNARQLNHLLQDNLFVPGEISGALYFPPVDNRPILDFVMMLQGTAVRLVPTFSGVILIEAEKQIYAASGIRKKKMARIYAQI